LDEQWREDEEAGSETKGRKIRIKTEQNRRREERKKQGMNSRR
jgi:hypothetical protein